MPLDMRQRRLIAETRTIEEELDYIRREGNLSNPEELLKRLLWALDIEKPKEKAENLVLLGCYAPYRIPLSLRAYLKLLERLGIEYTYLTKEYCCGVPLIEAAQGAGKTAEEMQKLEKTCKDFMQRNISVGRERGAKNTVYFCVWCAHLGKRFFPEDKAQFYFLDIVLDKLEKADLRVEPTAIGYYEGCHLRNRRWAPGVELDWPAYRRILDRIKGLRVVELTNKTCCVLNPNKVVEEAEKLNLDTIVCSCFACHIRAADAAKGRMRVQYLPDLLLEALGPAPA